MWSHSQALCRIGAAAMAIGAAPLLLAQAQDVRPAITLENGARAAASRAEAVAQLRGGDGAFSENYREFAKVKVGESSPPEVFTLNFHHATELTEISAVNDFRVSGGTCAEGRSYSAGDSCSVEVTFTAQGPGHRIGRLSISHTASARPFLVPTGGDATGPAVSFIPSKITKVESTLKDGTGILLDAQGLTTDGGDNLYIADSGNGLIRFMDSSGVMRTVAGGGTNVSLAFGGLPTEVKLSYPYGVAIDFQGNVFISDSGNLAVRAINTVSYPDSIFTRLGGGGGASTCTVSNPCSPGNATFSGEPPSGIAVDPSGNLFLRVENSLFGFLWGLAQAWNLHDYLDFYYLQTAIVPEGFAQNYPVAVDQNDDVLYDGDCLIVGQNQAFGALAKGERFWIAAGTGVCGFSGDGGLATGAEISSSIQGFAWDAAGNLYFTDTGNQRVRRIDGLTGVIRTVAGNGVAGFSGDNGPSTSAELNTPTGIAVDSRGNVYVISIQEVVVTRSSKPEQEAKPESTGPGGPTESIGLVREFGSMGQLEFASQGTGTSSAAQTVMVSNVGNDGLNFTNEAFTSGNTGDFAIDPKTTSCNFTVTLRSGENCLIGIIFTPTATGARSAVLTLLDDTVNGSNAIELSGTGVTSAAAKLSPEAMTFAAQPAGTSSTQIAKLENSGDAPLTIESYKVTGPNAADFSETHTCGETLGAGAKCAIDVKFTPTEKGARSATLNVETSVGVAALEVKATSK